MAIYHCSMKQVSRSSGRSAVASAAYRAAQRLTNQRDGVTHDFTRKGGVEQVEIVLPDGIEAPWALDRSALWNAAEFAEKRKDARVAREYEIALPHELTPEQRLELTRAFAQAIADRYGVAVDFAIHAPHEQSDVRNHHAHLLATTRQVSSEGLGEKALCERENKWLLGQGLPTTTLQLIDIRRVWEEIANAHLARAGLDIRVDHRSHVARGLELAPSAHMGVQATQMQRRGLSVERARLDEDALRRNAELIRQRPEQVLLSVTGERSVFDRRDVARALHRSIGGDDLQGFQNALAAAMASPELVLLQAERVDPQTGEVQPARYSTREIIEIEKGLSAASERLFQNRGHGVGGRRVHQAMARQDAALQARGGPSARLSEEQRHAIAHVTGPEGIAAVVGFAGAGKSTMLAAAREAWEAQGYRVFGAALSGKAAEGLEESSGIASRTLASWANAWESGRRELGSRDVFVIDEAGMIGSRQLARFVGEVEARGAKLVLIGDHEQLQAIGAGAAFRAIAEQIGHASLSDIRRQREDWQREASVAFATHRTVEGLDAYRAHGGVRFAENAEQTRTEVVRDYLADTQERPSGSRVAMAHRRADVRALNEDIRSALQDRGDLPRGAEAGELTFATNDGPRRFAPGDRIVFLENDRDLNVKNGMLGEIETVAPGRITARLDAGAQGGPSGSEARRVVIASDDYRAIDHGYATTIHKNQGSTVDRAFVLASSTMDRHLTYVAMTRHRDEARLYAAADEFAAHRRAGALVAHGAALYEHRTGNRDSYFVTLAGDDGAQRTYWGADLARAMSEAAPAIGATIGLEREERASVQGSEGRATRRASWRVLDAEALAWRGLGERLSRSGVKETTLDYAREFGARRGIEPEPGVEATHHAAVGQAEPTHSLRIAARAVAIPGVEHTTSIAVEAERRALGDSGYKDARAVIDEMAQRVYREPVLAVEKIVARIMDDRGSAEATSRLIIQRPEAFGALRGGDSFLDFKGRAERKAALGYVGALATFAARLPQAHALALARASEDITRERAREAIAVPALSHEAQQRIRALGRLVYKDPARIPEAHAQLRQDKALSAEIDAFRAAFRQRFGSGAMHREEAGKALQSLPRERRSAFAAAFALEARLRNVGHVLRDHAQVLARQQARSQQHGQGPTLTMGW